MNKFGQPPVGSLSEREVDDFHKRSDVDEGPLAQHHTIGPGPYQAAPGNHRHGDSTPYGEFNALKAKVDQLPTPISSLIVESELATALLPYRLHGSYSVRTVLGTSVNLTTAVATTLFSFNLTNPRSYSIKVLITPTLSLQSNTATVDTFEGAVTLNGVLEAALIRASYGAASGTLLPVGGSYVLTLAPGVVTPVLVTGKVSGAVGDYTVLLTHSYVQVVEI